LLDEHLCFLKSQNELNETIIKEILIADIETISKGLISIIKKDGVKQITDRILA
jgi:hypothetical protein